MTSPNGEKNWVAPGERQAVVRADWNISARLAVVAQTRNLNMSQVLFYELGPLPLSIASPDGGLAKTAKSELLPLWEGSIPAVEVIPPPAGIWLDKCSCRSPTDWFQVIELTLS